MDDHDAPTSPSSPAPARPEPGPHGEGGWPRPDVLGGPRRIHPPHVYHRRRAVIVTLVVLAGWLVGQATGGGGGLLGGEDRPADASPADRPVAAVAAAPVTTGAPCPSDGPTTVPPGGEPVPDALAEALEATLASTGLAGDEDAGIAVWVDGYGQVLDENADRPLAPASNQKLLTAMGALELLDPEARLVTQVRSTGPVDDDGVVHGDLVVVGGGDPLIKREGPHSVDDLAAELADAGITRVAGDVVGDESRYDQVRRAPGWLEWEMPLPGGAMSALMVNSNSRRGDAAYLANPTLHNAELVAEALDAHGVEVEGGPAVGTAPPDSELVHEYPSPPIGSVVRTMLRDSDNMAAELLAKEVGLQVRGDPSTEAGLEAMEDALERSLCLDISGLNDDASGISRDNRRPARNWQDLLLAARDEPWFGTFRAGLPEAGAPKGTLAGRFLGTGAEGHVWAKTGTIGTAAALSGYAETAGGREVVFSIVVNGDQPEDRAVPAIDAVVTAVQADDS